MSLIQFSPRNREDKSRKHRVGAFLASCVFHGFLLCLILGLTYHYRSSILLFKSGSKASEGRITLSTLVISSPPPAPKSSPAPPAPHPSPAPISSPAATAPQSKPPEEALPVLAAQPTQTEKSNAPAHPEISHSSAVPTTAQARPKPAAAVASSYAAGANILPHPPYPPEARERRQTGTVIMNVQFDAQGTVTQAEVAESSGVRILDTCTSTFIRMHWHSLSYAGQTVSVPVQYKLENL